LLASNTPITYVGFLLKNIISGDGLFLRIGGQAVGTGQIHHADLLTTAAADALFLLDRLARPVAHVLSGTGEGVE